MAALYLLQAGLRRPESMSRVQHDVDEIAVYVLRLSTAECLCAWSMLCSSFDIDRYTNREAGAIDGRARHGS
jgi:hypothetical protein